MKDMKRERLIESENGDVAEGRKKMNKADAKW